MNIYMVGPSLHQKGGVVTVMCELIFFMGTQGVNVEVLSTTTDKGKLSRVVRFFFTWKKLIASCVLRRCDIVHIHMASRGSALRKSILALSCWILRTPYVIHLHGAEFRIFYNDELGPLGRALVRFVLARASRVIALSEAWKKWLEQTLGLINISVVLNGTPPLRLDGSKEEKATVLFLGRLCQRKGVNELIEAMVDVMRRAPNTILELGGDGDVHIYKKLAAELPSVRFLGWVDDAERKKALARATIYCLPSWNEGLPMSVLEAMSAGLPVISTPVGGIPEAVEHGVTGLLVEPGDVTGLTDAICELLFDPERAGSMGKKGLARHREKFSTESMGNSCLNIYKSVLGRD